MGIFENETKMKCRRTRLRLNILSTFWLLLLPLLHRHTNALHIYSVDTYSMVEAIVISP